jgi:flagellar capping protein FliD
METKPNHLQELFVKILKQFEGISTSEDLESASKLYINLQKRLFELYAKETGCSQDSRDDISDQLYLQLAALNNRIYDLETRIKQLEAKPAKSRTRVAAVSKRAS